MRDFSSSTGRSCPALPKHRGRWLLGSIFGRPHGTINELEFWRERILWAIFAGGVAMSPLALLPAVMMLLDSGHYQMVFIDIAAVIFACVLLRLRGSIPYLLRAGIAVLIVYTVGLGVILTVGIASGGSAWLFCFAVLAGVLLGVKGAFWALSLNAVTFAFLGYFSWRGSLAIGSVFQSDVQAAVAGINFLFLNAVCAISVAVLVRGMENAANRERAVALDLEQSRTRLSIIFDHAAVGLVETELNGRLTRVNRFFAELLGYAVSRLEGRQMAEISHPEDVPQETKRVRELLKRPTESYAMEKRFCRNDGVWIWTRVTVSLVRDARDRPIHLIGVIEDITERKQALDALQESEWRYRSILESAPDAITISRLSDGCYLEVNPYFCRISGYSRREVIGHTPAELRLYANPADHQRLVRVIETKEEVNGLEMQYRRKDGKILDFLLSARHLQFGGESCLVVVGTDITESKRVALALDKSESRFQQLAEMMPETLFESDAAGRLSFVNRQALVTFGYSAADVAKGLKAIEMIAPEERERAVVNMARIRGGAKPLLNEYTAVRKDGTRFPVMIRSAPIFQEGRFSGLRGFIIDLTENKKLETRIRQSQRLESIGTLAGGIAHDFNNILSAVLGYSDLSLTEVRPGDLIHGYLLKIRQAGMRARDMVRQILTFSRKSDQEMVAVEIRPIINEALKLIRATLPSTIEIRTNLEFSATISADPTQIHQVLMNLCTNAGHAMATGGVLTVALTELDHTSGSEASLTCSGPCVRLTVSDTGCGMTAEVLERIFDPFFTTKGADKGTGLGLSVVHGIIKSHGGSISAVSTPDQGSVFTIDLPIIQSDSRRKAQETLPLPHGTESVLWVDDEPFQVELGCEFLQRLGYRVEGRDRADEALELFRAAPYDFDLVITDMTMPRMTGEVLSSAILAIRPDIPVILCTGYSEQISEPQAVAKGIAAFAFKPIELAELAQLVRRVLNERSTARALRSHD